MARRAAFTQADIKRAVKGAKDAGLVVTGVEIDGSKISILSAQTAPEPEPSAVDSWRRKKNARAVAGH